MTMNSKSDKKYWTKIVKMSFYRNIGHQNILWDASLSNLSQ